MQIPVGGAVCPHYLVTSGVVIGAICETIYRGGGKHSEFLTKTLKDKTSDSSKVRATHPTEVEGIATESGSEDFTAINHEGTTAGVIEPPSLPPKL